MPTKGPPTVGETLKTLSAVAAERDRVRAQRDRLLAELKKLEREARFHPGQFADYVITIAQHAAIEVEREL